MGTSGPHRGGHYREEDYEPAEDAQAIDPNMGVPDQLRHLATSLDNLTAFLLEDGLTRKGVVAIAEAQKTLSSCLRLAALLAPGSEDEEWMAVIEGVAMEEMGNWKADGFEHAYTFARRIAARSAEIMREPAGVGDAE